jgi:hypothetical protein
MNFLKKFFDFSADEKLMFFEALVFLYLAKMMLIILPFRICIKTLKKGEFESISGTGKVRAVKSAIDRANRLAFWKNVCLVQSFAARWMLDRRKMPSTFSIGVKHDRQKKISAHAWLTVGNFEIVPRGGDYITIVQY